MPALPVVQNLLPVSLHEHLSIGYAHTIANVQFVASDGTPTPIVVKADLRPFAGSPTIFGSCTVTPLSDEIQRVTISAELSADLPARTIVCDVVARYATPASCPWSHIMRQFIHCSPALEA